MGLMLNIAPSFIIPIASLVLCMLLANYLGKTKYFSFLESRKDRFGSIDGVRGFLALFVFFHHFIITYYWKMDGQWKRPPEDIFQNYGKVGVAIFFMITGFLFFSKISNKERPVNWGLLYQSRLFRILPLYIFALTVITLIVFANSNYQLNVTPFALIKQFLRWGLFIGGSINGFLDTKLIIAGVDWTLKYEWLFYLSLPVIALINKKLGMIGLLLLVMVSLVGFISPLSISYFSSTFIIYFCVGAAISSFSNKINAFIEARHFLISSINLILVILILLYPNTLDLMHVGMISVLFMLIAGGNTMFGLFSLRASIILGEISYSIYLLHGIILYLIFTVISPISFENYQVREFIYFMPLISVLVVVVATFTYLIIEKPCIEIGRKLTFSTTILKDRLRVKY
jgi:peptidoglycan/LPS O-acetylase OafA/YrhL